PGPRRPTGGGTGIRQRRGGRDDKPLRALLDGALPGEPPIGPVAQNALAAGIRLRRRRRIRAAAVTAAAAVIAVAIPAGLGASGHLLRPAEPNQRPAAPTPHIYTYGHPRPPATTH